ncbi:hypothetical protein LAJLEIBI_02993 [[Clostridium] hylemonae DSM 15053]|uniref:sugar ABC transporter substrate-binding protein n=1 Tax=[Clostridium] hylemonae TaxID=89153 RepID=UPI0011EE636D|nr:sugar ABC transporter substrate-binding protein [[Clostridium] hylemonae]QEK18969.1 hypothetical protein LAJLEIBI_02993 [[Clostridium] hylemonae DSM 15053]
MCLSLAACSSGEKEKKGSDSGDKKEESVKVAFSIPEMFSTFWEACWYGFEKQAKEYGWEATLLDPQGDLELQISQLQSQVTKALTP